MIAQTVADAVHFFLYDGRGSTRALVDALGLPLSDQVYGFDAFGNPIGFDPGSSLTSLLHNGEQFDLTLQMQYLLAKYYNPVNGRFTRLDPFMGDVADPLSLHKYVYGHGDPIENLDPTGRFVGTMVGLIVGISVYNYLRALELPAEFWWVPTVTASIAGFFGAFLPGWRMNLVRTAPLWSISAPSGLPAPRMDQNIPIMLWIWNVEKVLNNYIDANLFLATGAQIAAARQGANEIAREYVLAVQERAKQFCEIEKADSTWFGVNGKAGWGLNVLEPEAKCAVWAEKLDKKLYPFTINTGWVLRAHLNCLKIGSLDYILWTHSYLSLTYVPGYTGGRVGRNPDFVLDPWSQARPHIFDAAPFMKEWPENVYGAFESPWNW